MDVHDHFTRARRDGRRALDEAAAKQVLEAFGVAVPRGVMVADAADAGAVDDAVAGLNAPYVVKVMSPELLHKSDAGGVVTGVQTAKGVRAAIDAMAQWPAIAAARLDGFLVEEMAPAGHEVVIGATYDARFGPMIMVGLGGVFVEVLKDVSFRICPITAADADAMLDELQGAALLAGARGRAPASRRAIARALLAVGGSSGLLAAHGDEIEEIDINPLIVSAEGAVAADARIVLAVEPEPARITMMGAVDGPVDAALSERFEALFAPSTIAVAGASASSTNMANTFITRLQRFGFEGAIYPIHPSAPTIEGLAAYASLGATPEPVDYASIVVAAARVPELLAGADGRVRFAQVLSAGFAEIAQGTELEHTLLEAAQTGGCRLIGPNCLGVYSPRGRVTFPERASTEAGPIGIVTQSGGLATDMISRGQTRGLRFSGVVTIGNSADLGPADFLEYFLADPATGVVGLYLEDVKDGHRFFRRLRAAGGTKPIVVLPGGRTAQGGRAAASHTGALAGDARVWRALARQTGCTLVDHLDEFLDVLLAFQFLTPRPERPTKRVVLFGNGGGSSVLASDIFARRGLDTARFDDLTRAALEGLELPPGTSIENPIDTPVATLQKDNGRIAEKILDAVYAGGAPDAVVMHLNLAAFAGRGSEEEVLGNLIEAAMRVRARYPGQAHFVLVLRSDEAPETDAFKRLCRERALAAGIPVYDEIYSAALPLAALGALETHLGGPAPEE